MITNLMSNKQNKYKNTFKTYMKKVFEVLVDVKM